MKKLKINCVPRIMFIVPEFPSPIGGATTRNYNILKYLSKKKLDIEVLSPPGDLKKLNLNIKFKFFDNKEISNLRKLLIAIFYKRLPDLHKRKDLKSLILKHIKNKKPEIIQLESLYSYPFIKEIIPFLKKENIKIILDQHNVEKKVLSSAISIAKGLKRILLKRVYKSLLKLENEAIKNSDVVLCCSENDKKEFLKIDKTKEVVVIPNGVDCNYFSKINVLEGNNILFLARFGYPPNDDALDFYFEKIYPILKKNYKDAVIHIIGKEPPEWLIELSKNDKLIVVTGFVENIKPYLKKANVCICPLRYGSGTRLKILEYLASGKPVVSTIIGAEGINVINKKNIILTDDPKRFAEAIIKILKNPKLAKKMGENGRRLVEEKYSWNKIVKQTEDVYKEVLEEHAKKTKK